MLQYYSMLNHGRAKCYKVSEANRQWVWDRPGSRRHGLAARVEVGKVSSAEAERQQASRSKTSQRRRTETPEASTGVGNKGSPRQWTMGLGSVVISPSGVRRSHGRIRISVRSQVCKRHRMPLVEMFVVNWRPVRRRLLTENIAFVRLKGNVPIRIYQVYIQSLWRN